LPSHTSLENRRTSDHAMSSLRQKCPRMPEGYALPNFHARSLDGASLPAMMSRASEDVAASAISKLR